MIVARLRADTAKIAPPFSVVPVFVCYVALSARIRQGVRFRIPLVLVLVCSLFSLLLTPNASVARKCCSVVPA